MMGTKIKKYGGIMEQAQANYPETYHHFVNHPESRPSPGEHQLPDQIALMVVVMKSSNSSLPVPFSAEVTKMGGSSSQIFSISVR